jgi:hypothetical protein
VQSGPSLKAATKGEEQGSEEYEHSLHPNTPRRKFNAFNENGLPAFCADRIDHSHCLTWVKLELFESAAVFSQGDFPPRHNRSDNQRRLWVDAAPLDAEDPRHSPRARKPICVLPWLFLQSLGINYRAEDACEVTNPR